MCSREVQMPSLIGVANTPPVYALGLAGSLPNDRFSIEVAAKPSAWLEEHSDAALVLGVHDDSDFEILVDLVSAAANLIVITVVDGLNAAALRNSLAAGATSVIDINAVPAEVSVTLDAALLHQTVVPASLARDITQHDPNARPTPDLTDDELTMLRSLVSGATVAELGRSVGYSDREIYRRLRKVYRKLGVQCRVDALVKASRWGLLD